jgi:hypothetical protein
MGDDRANRWLATKCFLLEVSPLGTRRVMSVTFREHARARSSDQRESRVVRRLTAMTPV